ncbi:MAG: SDR family oxidoreductase [Solirubrobacteraceae bacterium]
MSTRAEGRVAIVTGGSRGVGRAVARSLARRRHAVVVNYATDQQAGEDAVEEILEGHGTALAVRADVADQLDVERLFDETNEAFGGVDVVVHGAGRVLLGPLAELDLGAFDALQRTNVRGTFVVNQQAARRLRDGGAIVNLSSFAVGLGLPGYAAYAASKGAVEAITLVLASELRGRNITVNAVATEASDAEEPRSDVEDAIVEQLGSRAPELQAMRTDTAELVALLVGEEGRRITGQILRAGGGVVPAGGRPEAIAFG